MNLNGMQIVERDGGNNKAKITARGVPIHHCAIHFLKNVDVDILDKTVSTFDGPSGFERSTFLRCLNGMNDAVASARVFGKVLVDGEDIYNHRVDPVQLRTKIGIAASYPVRRGRRLMISCRP